MNANSATPDWVYTSNSTGYVAFSVSGYVKVPLGWRGRLVRWLCR